MSKVNLLTRHFRANFGSFFQTYATCILLKSLNHKVTVIDLQNKHLFIKNYFPNNVYRLRQIPMLVLFALCRFYYLPRKTRLIFSLKKFRLPKSDIDVVGSDQVWNPDITKDLIFDYYLPTSTVRRISLASSFGLSEWNQLGVVTEKVRYALQRFSFISVRETSGVRICRDVFGVEACRLIDPVFALDDYSRFIKLAKYKFDYIFYFIQNREGYSKKVVDKLSMLMKKKVVMYSLHGNSFGFVCANSNVTTPSMWLSDIYYSDFVVSDSFHCVAFAIYFNKPFVALVNRPERIDRILSLLTLLGLSDRLVYPEDVEDIQSHLNQIDWNQVNVKLCLERKRFMDFLQSALL